MTIICSVCYDSCQRMFPLQEILCNAAKVSLQYTAQIQVLTFSEMMSTGEGRSVHEERNLNGHGIAFLICFSIQPLFCCTVSGKFSFL